MDLSQQELPLTSYFSKATKENRSTTESSKKRKPNAADTEARPCKRGKDVQSASVKSTRNAQGRTTDARVNAVHLPTPSTSARKRVSSTRGGQSRSSDLQSSANKTSKASSSNESAPSDVIDLTHTDTEGTPSKALPKAKREKADGRIAFHQTLVTPSSHSGLHVRGGQKISSAKPPEVALPTPETGLRKTCAPAVSESPSAARSRFSRLGAASRRSSSPGLPPQVITSVKLPTPAMGRVSRSHNNNNGIGASHLHDERDPFSAQMEHDEGINSQEFQHRIIRRRSMSELNTSEISHVPMQLVPSSQSQYLLHIDATPKHKRFATGRFSVVPTSQVLEEGELHMSKLPPLVPESALHKEVKDKLSKGNPLQTSNMSPPHSPVRTPRRNVDKRVNRHTYTLCSTPLTSPVTSPNGPSRSFLVTKQAGGKAFFKPSPRQGERSPYRPSVLDPRSPNHRTLVREDSMKDAPPVAEDDSETEPESDTPNRKTLSRVNRQLVCERLAETVSLVPEDSVTEPESDTDILHCVAAIGKKRARQVDVPALTEIGLLRVGNATLELQSANVASSNSTQNFTQEVPSLPATFALRGFDRTKLPGSADSMPSAVREFMHMFQGEGSYPEDFPESLRV